MAKVDVSIIETLTSLINQSIEKFKSSLGTDDEKNNFIRMIFITKFSNDVLFLNDLNEENIFYHRYGYLILRNMLEQLIEFLYLQKNTNRIDEYLGYKIDLKSLKGKSIVEKVQLFGKKRYIDNRPRIIDMAKDTEEYESTTGGLTLYNVYSILSEKCHNSYFDSLMDDFNTAKLDISKTGLNDEQMTLLNVMISCVMIEYC